MRFGWLATVPAIALLAISVACSSKPVPEAAPSPAPVVLQPRETFNWNGEKISFSITPAGWRREGETSGGILGARFVKEHSPEAIGFGDYYSLSDPKSGGFIEHFSLPDVLDRVEFKPEKRQDPDWYRLLGRRDAAIAGEPAIIVDYTVKVPERHETYTAREEYFVHNSHLFVCTFIGFESSLPVFDAMIASIQFPQ
jgi:hypothetical protein